MCKETNENKEILFFEDPDKIYGLMTGTTNIKANNIIDNEFAYGTECEKLLGKCQGLYNEVDNMDEYPLFEKFYDLLYQVTTNYYIISFYNLGAEDFSAYQVGFFEQFFKFVECYMYIKVKQETLQATVLDKVIYDLNNILEIFVKKSVKYGKMFRNLKLEKCVNNKNISIHMEKFKKVEEILSNKRNYIDENLISIWSKCKKLINEMKNTTLHTICANDPVYQKDRLLEKESVELYEQLELTAEEKSIINNYLSAIKKVHQDFEVNCYITGMIDMNDILKLFNFID